MKETSHKVDYSEFSEVLWVLLQHSWSSSCRWVQSPTPIVHMLKCHKITVAPDDESLVACVCACACWRAEKTINNSGQFVQRAISDGWRGGVQMCVSWLLNWVWIRKRKMPPRPRLKAELLPLVHRGQRNTMNGTNAALSDMRPSSLCNVLILSLVFSEGTFHSRCWWVNKRFHLVTVFKVVSSERTQTHTHTKEVCLKGCEG